MNILNRPLLIMMWTRCEELNEISLIVVNADGVFSRRSVL
jgi:hypothetical protein